MEIAKSTEPPPTGYAATGTDRKNVKSEGVSLIKGIPKATHARHDMLEEGLQHGQKYGGMTVRNIFV